jgi:hypothetical protein
MSFLDSAFLGAVDSLFPPFPGSLNEVATENASRTFYMVYSPFYSPHPSGEKFKA